MEGSYGLIVLFSSIGAGTVVHGGTGTYAGREGFVRNNPFDGAWGMKCFKPFHGTVEITS